MSTIKKNKNNNKKKKEKLRKKFHVFSNTIIWCWEVSCLSWSNHLNRNSAMECDIIITSMFYKYMYFKFLLQFLLLIHLNYQSHKKLCQMKICQAGIWIYIFSHCMLYVLDTSQYMTVISPVVWCGCRLGQYLYSQTDIYKNEYIKRFTTIQL